MSGLYKCNPVWILSSYRLQNVLHTLYYFTSTHFSTMLYRASDVHRDRFEVTQCEGIEAALCFHKFMDHVVFTDVDSMP